MIDDKIIENWLKVDYSCSTGYGYGYGHMFGSNDSVGFGCGASVGSGDSDGRVFGGGCGPGCGTTWGTDDDYGKGYGYGDVYGRGYGKGDYYDGLKKIKINGYKIYEIDNISTIVIKIKNNIAQGYIVNKDLTLDKTYVVKGNNMFAHGKTIKEAYESLQEKIFNELDLKERIKEFRKAFKVNEKYSGHDFFKWHHILTGSCLQGRLNFVKNNNIDLNKTYTVKEFIEICQYDYGSGYIKELKQYYMEEK